MLEPRGCNLSSVVQFIYAPIHLASVSRFRVRIVCLSDGDVHDDSLLDGRSPLFPFNVHCLDHTLWRLHWLAMLGRTRVAHHALTLLFHILFTFGGSLLRHGSGCVFLALRGLLVFYNIEFSMGDRRDTSPCS